MIKAAVNMPCMCSGELTSAYLLGVFLGMELLGSRGSVRLVLFDAAQRFPQMVQTVYAPGAYECCCTSVPAVGIVCLFSVSRSGM